MTEVFIPVENSPGQMRQVKCPISEHSHKSCIYPHRFCHRANPVSRVNVWSYVKLYLFCLKGRPHQIRCVFPAELTEFHLLQTHCSHYLNKSWILMGNTVATFTLHHCMHCIRNVTHSVTTRPQDKYFTVFYFNIFLAKRTVFQVTMPGTLQL